MKVLRGIVAIFLVAAGNVSAVGADDALAPRPSIVLLTNGQLLEGAITASGDYYDMQVRAGQIRLRRSQVAHIAQSVCECYEFKRGEIQIERAVDHLDLADWCMKNKLFDEAAEEIVAARRADTAHPKIPLLETRLRLARQAAASPPRVAEQETGKTPPAGATPNALAVNDVSPTSMASFAQHIQPLLINNCTGSGCHSAQSSAAMRLERLPINRYTGRKSTQRNLQSVLSQIDRGNPMASRLLKAALEPHGGAKQAVFSNPSQSQFIQLARWTYQVSGSLSPAAEPTLEERTAPLAEHGPHAVIPSNPVAAPIAGATATSALPAAMHGAVVNDPAMARAQAAALADSGLAGASSLAPGAAGGAPRPSSAGEYVPKDPFDPEVFNRLYHGR